MIGVAIAADAHADDADDVLGQAVADPTQGTQLLDQAPEASLDAEQAAVLAGQESFQTGSAPSFLAEQESVQSMLPAADLTSVLTSPMSSTSRISFPSEADIALWAGG